MFYLILPEGSKNDWSNKQQMSLTTFLTLWKVVDWHPVKQKLTRKIRKIMSLNIDKTQKTIALLGVFDLP